MAINAYTGLMGTGKSYEVTLNVVLPAILNGRRVVTNIDGIDEGKIHDYLKSKNPKHEGEFGKIVHVRDEDVEKPGFFPREDGESIVCPGDLVVIDEAWLFWAIGKKLSPEHMSFFRLHRHYAHAESGVTCDLVVIFQAISDVHRSLRNVVEVNFRTTKLKTLGLSRSYRIEWWDGGKQTKAASLGFRVTRYVPAVFPLYNSYNGSAGTELSVDSRQNIFNNPRLWMYAIGLFVVAGYSVWWLWTFLHPKPDGPKGTEPPSSVVSGRQVKEGSFTKDVSSTVTERRIGGVVTLPGEKLIVVVDRLGRFSYDSTYEYSGTGLFLVGQHKAKRIDASPFAE
ncbi:zonular occludens toxin domain-containing protein [Achromobacter denitrificans]|uniref:zonular occludens toxin domain-containing protein n=1 Tax=Achromobacter denitrificans TaxID=32002 RepID=UPI000B4922B1|nr:zonular occludens toxin domain-containing protein [Achromobacter denitrificans]